MNAGGWLRKPMMIPLPVVSWIAAHAVVREGNLAEIERYNAQRRNPAAQAIPQDALMGCLQSTAGAVVARCKETKCDPALLVDIIGEVQKLRCGYYAIQPIQ